MISRSIREEEFRERLYNCKTAEEVIRVQKKKKDREEAEDKKCPFCNSEDTKVVDSRTALDGL